jgi:uncharacterized membrane protein
VAAKTTTSTGGAGSAPADQLKESLRSLAGTVATRATSSVSQKVNDTTGRLNDYAAGGDGSLLTAVTGAKKLSEGRSPLAATLGAAASGLAGKATSKIRDLGPAGGGQGDTLKVTNIVEQIDVGVPVDVAYDQWTRFTDFPSFMKKVENVEQESDERISWKAQVFWSHRTWDATIVDQVPDERIVWRSEGDKGHVDGAVTFHEVGPQLTRIIAVLEYHPGGFLEKTANLWRAQGRRARLELKHFQRHVMTETVLHPQDGWRGEIRDGEVVAEPQPTDETDETDEADEADESDQADEPDGK